MPHRVSYTGHTKIIYLWPIILMGYLFRLFPESWTHTETLAWVYLLLSLTCNLAVTVDLSRNYGIFWLVFILLVVVSGMWLKDRWQIPLLSNLIHWFAGLNVHYDRGYGLAFSIILSFFFVIGLFWAWANHRYTMTHNEVVHHVWGRGDRSVGRGARIINVTYPDWFEFLLCFAGTIVVHDSTGRTTICRSENVPLLPFRARKIDKILETVRVTDESSAAMDAEAYATDRDANDLV
jgi:hypothetical protein